MKNIKNDKTKYARPKAVLIFLLFLICLLTTGAFGIAAADKVYAAGPRIISWGVNPNSKELTPDPPDGSRAILDANNGIFIGKTDQKKVYLTFDLGYEAGYTEKVLDILKENNIQAIFFLCGNYLKEDKIIGRMISEGHLIGNHTDRHKDLPTLPKDEIKKDVTALTLKFNEKYPGVALKHFRPPKGRFDERTLREASSNGLKTVLWSIAIVDWGSKPVAAALNADKIASRVHPGAVVLLHITNSGTPDMLKELLPKIARKGYEVGRADEL
jgi:peptidoglycan-N-acetylmuramic acid deacetylase